MVYNGIETTTDQAIRGFDVLYFVQSVNAPIGSPAILPAFQTGGTTTLGGEYIDNQTKQGRLLRKGTDEHGFELTQYFVPNDQALKDLEAAQASGDSIKVWEVVTDKSVAVDSEEEGVALYPAKFGYVKVGELSYDHGDELTEVSYDGNVVGRLRNGQFPLSEDDLNVINDLYEYQNPGETTGDYYDIQREDSAGAEDTGEPGTEDTGESGA